MIKVAYKERQAIVKVFYSKDGESWLSIGYLNQDDDINYIMIVWIDEDDIYLAKKYRVTRDDR